MKRVLALCAALLCLCGCASLLEREYTEAVDHVEDQPPGDAAYRVETYPALRAAILAYVEEGMTEGTLRCPTTYPGNLSVDLEKAKRQLMEEDPLGCYALEDITFHTSRIIAYYDIELELTYKVDTKEVAGLPRVGSREALSRMLGQSLEDREGRVCVYLTAYPEEDGQFFAAALRDAYGLRPDVIARPELKVELYPQSGTRRVAALELDYGEELDGLDDRQERLREELEGSWTQGEASPDGEELFAALKGRCRLAGDGGATAYDALVEGRANAEGLSLGYAALCRHWGIECRVVWTRTGCYAALVPQAGAEEEYVDLTAERFAPLEALPDDGGGTAG